MLQVCQKQKFVICSFNLASTLSESISIALSNLKIPTIDLLLNIVGLAWTLYLMLQDLEETKLLIAYINHRIFSFCVD